MPFLISRARPAVLSLAVLAVTAEARPSVVAQGCDSLRAKVGPDANGTPGGATAGSVVSTATATPAAPLPSAKPVDAARINGTYTSRSNTIRLLALGSGKVKVQFSLQYDFAGPSGPTANMGYGTGEATLTGDAIVYASTEEGPCTITMTLAPGTDLRVTQVGGPFDCGFGNRVTADGTYRRVAAGPPVFESLP